MTLIGLYTDSDTIGGAERSLLNLVAAYRGEAQLVILSTSPHFLREASHLQGANSTLVHARSSLMRGALDHRRQFLDLGLDLLQVTLANPFASRPALLGGVLARPGEPAGGKGGIQAGVSHGSARPSQAGAASQPRQPWLGEASPPSRRACSSSCSCAKAAARDSRG